MMLVSFYIQPNLCLQDSITISGLNLTNGTTLRLHGRMIRKLFLHSVTECGSKQRLKLRRRLFSALVRVSVRLSQGLRHLSMDTFATCESYKVDTLRKQTNTIWNPIQTLYPIRHLTLVLFLRIQTVERMYTRSYLSLHLNGRCRHESGHALVRGHMDRRGCMTLGHRGTWGRTAFRRRHS